MASASLNVNATRSGVTAVFGPYLVEPAHGGVAAFQAYVRTFFIFRQWIVNSITPVVTP